MTGTSAFHLLRYIIHGSPFTRRSAARRVHSGSYMLTRLIGCPPPRDVEHGWGWGLTFYTCQSEESAKLHSLGERTTTGFCSIFILSPHWSFQPCAYFVMTCCLLVSGIFHSICCSSAQNVPLMLRVVLQMSRLDDDLVYRCTYCFLSVFLFIIFL